MANVQYTVMYHSSRFCVLMSTKIKKNNEEYIWADDVAMFIAFRLLFRRREQQDPLTSGLIQSTARAHENTNG